MWEAIRQNQRRSMWLLALMGVLLVLLGALVGMTVHLFVADHAGVVTKARDGATFHETIVEWEKILHLPPPGELIWRTQHGIYIGIGAALLVWLILWLTAMAGGDRILLRSVRAREIEKADAPQLWNIVEEMTIASGLGKMPRVFIIDDSSLNAFAVGYRSDKAAVAVTAGLLKRLNRDELQGVIAHEIGHIRNQDVKFMTLAGVMVGAIVLVSHIFLRGVFYGSVGRHRSRGGGPRGAGGAAIVMLVITILFAVLAPLAAQILYFACSRKREYLADASSARYTRYPAGLASALEKIARKPAMAVETNKIVAPMYIINPLQMRGSVGLFATHPSTNARIEILRNLAGAGAAHYAAYEAAYRQKHGEGSHCIDEKSLRGDEQVAVREATPEPRSREQAVAQAQQVGDLLSRVLPLVIIGCPCGVKLKLPPKFKRDAVKCPRCGRKHEVPRTDQAGGGGKAVARGPQKYRRRGTGWETFQCRCGHPVQLSPSFSAQQVRCSKCKARIEIEGTR